MHDDIDTKSEIAFGNNNQYGLDDFSNRVNVPNDKEIWKSNALEVCSTDYPIQSQMRWDSIPSDNNEDLFRGILYDYTGDFSDNVGQGIMFGIAPTRFNKKSNLVVGSNITPTASYRGVYKKDGYHEAHICVGLPENQRLDDRGVNKVIIASGKKIEVAAPIKLYNVTKSVKGMKELEPEIGMLAYTITEHDKEARLLFYTGHAWKQVKLSDTVDLEEEHEE
jgi:hypothetical protein